MWYRHGVWVTESWANHHPLAPHWVRNFVVVIVVVVLCCKIFVVLVARLLGVVLIVDVVGLCALLFVCSQHTSSRSKPLEVLTNKSIVQMLNGIPVLGQMVLLLHLILDFVRWPSLPSLLYMLYLLQ
jgi:hypothetical protein